MQARTDDLTVQSPDITDPPILEDPDEVTSPADRDTGTAGERSLFDDFDALLTDARTYVDAELNYQKSRAGFVANRLKLTVAFGVVAAFFAGLATIGLTVGLIIALTPLISAWGATAVVVLGLLLIAYLLVRRAARAWKDLSGAISSASDDGFVETTDDG